MGGWISKARSESVSKSKKAETLATEPVKEIEPENLPVEETVPIEKSETPKELDSIDELIQKTETLGLKAEETQKSTPEVAEPEITEISEAAKTDQDQKMRPITPKLDEIESFNRDSLRQSETQEKNMLPTSAEIAAEKLPAQIENFDLEKLKSVETEEKSTLPTQEQIGREKTISNIQHFDLAKLKQVDVPERPVITPEAEAMAKTETACETACVAACETACEAAVQSETSETIAQPVESEMVAAETKEAGCCPCGDACACDPCECATQSQNCEAVCAEEVVSLNSEN